MRVNFDIKEMKLKLNRTKRGNYRNETFQFYITKIAFSGWNRHFFNILTTLSLQYGLNEKCYYSL